MEKKPYFHLLQFFHFSQSRTIFSRRRSYRIGGRGQLWHQLMSNEMASGGSTKNLGGHAYIIALAIVSKSK